MKKNVDLKSAAYFSAAAYMPSILLFNLFNSNRDANHILLSHVVVLAVVLAVAGVLLFAFFKRLLGGPSAVIAMTFFWAGFWFFGAIRRVLLIPSSFLFISFLLLVCALIFLLWYFKPPLDDFSPVFVTLSIVFVVMFFINLAPAFTRIYWPAFISNLREGTNQVRRQPNINIKREFQVEPNHPKT